MSEFSFSLTEEEKKYLKDLVAWSIRTKLDGQEDGALPEPPTDVLAEPLGAFVTLKKGGSLRGCIGNVMGSGPLYRTVAAMARAAAFEDPRFMPLDERESRDVSIEISILGPVTPCPDPEKIEIGRHGLIMRKGGRSGLLLPQVPVEWNWDRETFLAQTCRKAGLPEESWQDGKTQILWFEAEVF